MLNSAPVAVDDVYSTPVSTLLYVDAPGILSNDIDADSDTKTATLVSPPTHGQLTLNPDGLFMYTPENGYHGLDSFTYKVYDGTAFSNVATVTLIDNTPTAVQDDYWWMQENVPSFQRGIEFGVLQNDPDADSDWRTTSLVSSTTHGSLTFGDDGSFSYIPDAYFYGLDGFTYKVWDGYEFSAVATVVFEVAFVNDPPTAVVDAYTVDESTTLTVSAANGLLINDSDRNGDAITARVFQNPAHGTLTLRSNGSFDYNPTPGYNGTDSFYYTAYDGKLNSTPTKVSITINNINSPPVATADTYSVVSNGSLAKNAAAGVLANDYEPEGEPFHAVKVTDPSHGALTFNADGSFTYIPTPGFHGSDSFTYKDTDGSADSKAVTVTFLVNSGPTASSDFYSVNEDSKLTVNAADGVLQNDVDIDGDPLTISLLSSVTHGDLTFAADGSFSYVPVADYFGSDSFTYKINDGFINSQTVSVTITVNSVNDLPTATGESYVTDEDATLTVNVASGVLPNDDDLESPTLTAVLVDDVQHGVLTLNANGSFTYVPELDYNGVDFFTYKAFDGTDYSNVVTVDLTINPTNDISYGFDDKYSTNENATLVVDAASGVLNNDYDPDGGSVEAILLTDPSHGLLILGADGSFTYTPEADYFGSDTFTYIATDSEPATVYLNISSVNQAPVGTNQSLVRNPAASCTLALAGVFTDPDGDSMAYSLVSQPLHGRASINNNGTPLNTSDDFLTYVPTAGYFYNDSFYVEASDGSFSDDVKITITARDVGLSPNPSTPSKTDLYVIGTERRDLIQLYPSGTKVKVFVNTVNKGTFNPTARIIVRGLGGSDIIDASRLARSVQIYGDAGNDKITGPSKPSTLVGGDGKDTIISGNAKDRILGAEVRSVLR